METYTEVVTGSNGYGYGYCYPQNTYYWTDRSQEIIDLLKEIKELLVLAPEVKE